MRSEFNGVLQIGEGESTILDILRNNQQMFFRLSILSISFLGFLDQVCQSICIWHVNFGMSCLFFLMFWNFRTLKFCHEYIFHIDF